MESQNFLKFCKEYKISRKNNGGALGQKLQKLEPNVRVSCVYNLFGPEELANPSDLFPPHNLSEIRCHQETMKITLGQGDLLAVVRSATLIIRISKANTIEARNAYSCRSAALFKLRRYHECLFDANRTLREHWDEGEKKIINDFKSRCLDRLLDDRYCEEKLKTVYKCRIDADDLDPNYEENFELPKIENPHVWIPNASQKIKIQFSSKYGRYLVAAEDISPGDLLFVDKPYAYVLGNERQLTNCSHCFMRCISLISCPNCKVKIEFILIKLKNRISKHVTSSDEPCPTKQSKTLLCSQKCETRARAFLQYHRIECQIMNNLKTKILDVESRLALRMLMIVTRQGKDVKNLLEHPIYKNPFDPVIRPIDKRHFEEDYYHIHHLESHDKELKNYDMVSFCYKAAVLIELLRWTTFFEKTRSVDVEPHSLTREQLFVSSLLLRYLTIIQFNGLMIRDRIEKPEKLQVGGFFFDMIQTGLAIYPISSLLNHSCNSNSLLINFKTSCACYATQPILKGEQIFINYECHYLIDSLEQRIKRLEDNYYFKCDCRPCEEKWPDRNGKSKLQRTSARLSKEEMMRYKNKMEWLVSLENVKEKYKLEQMNFLQDLMTKFYSSTKHPNVSYENAMSLFTNILTSKGNNYELDDNSVICNYSFYKLPPQKLHENCTSTQ